MIVVLRVIAAICSLSAAILIVYALQNTSWRMKSYETGYRPYLIDHYSEEGLWRVCSSRPNCFGLDCKHLSTEKTGKTKCYMMRFGLSMYAWQSRFFSKTNYLN